MPRRPCLTNPESSDASVRQEPQGVCSRLSGSVRSGISRDSEADLVLIRFVAWTLYGMGIRERLILVEADTFGDDDLVSLVEPECFNDHRLLLPIGRAHAA